MSEATSEPNVSPAPESGDPGPARKGGKLGKIAKGAGIAVVALLLVGRAMLPGVIKSQIEEKGTAALGVPVTLDGVSLSIMGGSASLEGFSIAQPEGFGSDPFFTAEELAVEVSIRSLLGNVVEIEEVRAKKPRLVVAKNSAGKANFDVIKENAAKASTGSGKGDGSSSKGDDGKGKGAILGELDVKDFALVMRDPGGDEAKIRFDRMKLEDVEFVPGSTEEKSFEFKLSGFAVEGPGKGFAAAAPMACERLKIEADLNSFVAKRPRIKLIDVTAPVVRAERNAQGLINYMEIARIAKSFAPAETDGGEAPSTAGGGSTATAGADKSEPPQDLAIDEILVHNVDFSMADAEKGTLSYKQAEFALRAVRIAPDGAAAPFTMDISGIEVAGPGKGFATQKPFELEQFTFAGDLSSCMAKAPVITSMKISKPIIRQEQNAEGLKNFDALKEVGLAFAPPSTDETAASGSGEGSGGDGSDTDSKGKDAAPYRLDSFEMSGGVYEMTMPGGAEGTETFRVTGIGVDMRDLSSPARADKPGQMTVRMNPFADDAKLAVKLLGNVGTHVEEERDISFDMDLKNFPLDVASRMKPGDLGFKTGRLDTKVEGTLKKSKVSSKVEVVGRELALESGKSGRDGKKSGGILGGFSQGFINSAIDTLEKPGTKETVPIRFELDMDYRWMTPEQRRTAIRKAIQDGVTNAIANAAGLKAEALAKGVGDAVKDAGGMAGDAVKGAGGVVKDAGNAAGSAVKGVGDAVGGLFGGGKKEEKKP